MSINEANPIKSTIVILASGEKFIEPELQDLFPELYALGSKKMLSNKYHLDNLYNILFRAANHRSTSPFFKKTSIFRGLRDDIDYHINQMFEHSDMKQSAIIDHCNKFEAVCDQFLSDTHPLSLELMSLQNRDIDEKKHNDILM